MSQNLCVLFMVIAAETDERRRAKWQTYNAGADMEAINLADETKVVKIPNLEQIPISAKWHPRFRL